MMEKGVNNTRCMEGKSGIENEDKIRKRRSVYYRTLNNGFNS
jgi:hypothetical protein